MYDIILHEFMVIHVSRRYFNCTGTFTDSPMPSTAS